MNYKRIYFQLIKKRKAEPLQKTGDGTIETHHIIPRSLGGSNDDANLVNLTLREHYIAHLLLFKIFKTRSQNPILDKKDKKTGSLRNMSLALSFMNYSQSEEIKNSRGFTNVRQRIYSDDNLRVFSLAKLKEMYEFYIVKNCSYNNENYKLFQNKFEYSGTKHSFMNLLRERGFLEVNKTIRYIRSKKIIGMYADFIQAGLSESKQKTDEWKQFQKKWDYHNSMKTLLNLFGLHNLSTKKSKIPDGKIMKLIIEMEKKFKCFTLNIVKSFKELNIPKKMINAFELLESKAILALNFR